MLLDFFLWHIFLIPILCSSNVTLSKTDHDPNKTLNMTKVPAEAISNHTIAIASEGSILHDIPAVALPNTNITVELMDLEKETGKNREKPIQPRKGVGSPFDIAVTQNNTSGHNDTEVKSNDSLKQKFEQALKSHKNVTLVPPAVVSNDTSTQDQAKIQNATKSEIPKKPLVVSSDALAKLEEKFDSSTKIPYVKSSSKTIVNDQLPSPNKEPYTKIYSMASKHPGMVTPIVITILVVPMFAVLGYMALKRGQEAWKNRHYKRMDFLLDGMYND